MSQRKRSRHGALGVAALLGMVGGAPALGQKATDAQPAVRPGGAQPTTIQPAPVPGAPGAAKGSEPGAQLPSISTDNPEMISLAAFTEPVQLSSLVDLLAATLKINIIGMGDVPGTVVFNAPVSVKKGEFLGLVDSLLEQQGYTITLDKTGFYTVRQVSTVPPSLAGDMPTTRVIATPNVRPSALTQAITAQLGAVSGAGGAPGVPGGGGGGRALSAVDELGVIIVTDTPRRLEVIQSLVSKILEEYAKAQFIRVEVKNVSAPVALQRVLLLVGQGGGTRTPTFGDPNQPPGAQPQVRAGGGGALDNLGDRLTVDPQGNALIFRGVQEEIERVRQAIAIVDKVSGLEPKRYEVGSAARQVADLANKRGLGDVTTISTAPTGAGGFQGAFQGGFEDAAARAINRQGTQAALTGGSVMVVDETKGSILYYGTEDQHTQMTQLIEALDPQSEAIVIRAYRLNHSKAEDLAELINGLIRNESPVAQNELLPGGGGRQGFPSMPRRNQPQQSAPTTRGEQGGPGELSLSGENAFVYPDKHNNQLLVKAPAKQQADFARLIDKLDLRRAQVFIEAKIVSVTWTDDKRLAFEQQLVNAGGRGGVLNTNFGLGTFGTTQPFTSAKTVNTGLPAFTAAVIHNNYVPVIMTALHRNVDSRILSTPQLLVDDNEEAKLASVDEQPTQTNLSTGTNNQVQTGFGGYEQAGTELTVKPQISDGGYMRLKYSAKLSSFTGAATASLPPPKATNEIQSDSVTVPGDMTVIVGGLNFTSKGRTKVSIPLLGDIPLLGALFSDDNKQDRKTTLYIFLTPHILRDANFQDLRLLSQGPQAESRLKADLPGLTPQSIPLARPKKE